MDTPEVPEEKPEETAEEIAQRKIVERKERAFKHKSRNFFSDFLRLLTLLPRLIWEGLMVVANLTDSTDKEGTIENIKEGIKIKGYNLWILVASCIIASIGLDTNSAAVIIGAMLISPLMSPILGIGLSIGINDRASLIDSIKNFGLAIGLSLLSSVLYFWITPLGEPTAELLARIKPTSLDIGVAFFGGIAGIVAGSRKEITNAIPGVAIATALMPPLCTAGYGLATFNLEFFAGAFYLFFLNAVFISLSTILMVRLLKFPMANREDDGATTKFAGWIALFVILVSIPSAYLLIDVVQEHRFKQQVNTFITTQFEDRDDCKVLHWEYLPADTIKNKGTLKVTLAGIHIADTVVAKLDTILQHDVDVKDVALFLIQTDYDPNEIRSQTSLLQTELENKINSKVYDQAEKTKISIIDSVRSMLQPYGHVLSPDTTELYKIQAELKALYPEMSSLALTRITTTDFDTITGPLRTVVIGWDKRVKYYKRRENEKRIYGYLKHRLNEDTLVVLNF